MKNIYFSILILFAVVSNAQTNVSGGIYANTTWSLTNSPYVVTGALTLFPGDTLKIEPGVVVKFDSGVGIEVRGTLISIGTITDSITFTSSSTTPAQGIWKGVFINNQLGASANIKYSIFKYGGYGIQNACCWGGGPLNISRSVFDNNGIGFDGYAGWVATVDSCNFINNSYGVTQADKIITHSTFLNNNYGLYSTERINVYTSSFCNNNTALYGGRGDLQNCTIMNNGTGVQSFYEGFTNVTGNTISKNNIGIILGTNGIGTNNNICSNTTYNIENITANNISIVDNCWCDTNAASISNKIYDGYDNISYGLLNFTPYLHCDTSVLPLAPCVANDQLATIKQNNFQKNNLVSVFPNPTSGPVTIYNTEPIDEIKITNMLGQLVFENKPATEKIVLQVENKGIYFITIKTGLQLTTKKLIVN